MHEWRFKTLQESLFSKAKAKAKAKRATTARGISIFLPQLSCGELDTTNATNISVEDKDGAASEDEELDILGANWSPEIQNSDQHSKCLEITNNPSDHHFLGASGQGTPYQYGLFFFDLRIPPEYPDVPPGFEQVIRKHFRRQAPHIRKACDAYSRAFRIGSLGEDASIMSRPNFSGHDGAYHNPPVGKPIYTPERLVTDYSIT
ncbi:hypothetical protein FXO38_06208 [Capsicum annuum]|nr:hypothetical protein FXO37_33676 [Capsicum annuum]KAF3672230.1 hypothetical protein FXO38_06208 [Capsicum annuum]